jgi:protoporphyrinogen/coproporphyrinogen III oxidase
VSRVAVVGGGIAGLAAAHELVQLGEEVVLLEASDRLGGKIRTTPFAGRLLDEGPDAFLARVPWAVELAKELGLADDLVSPAKGSALVWAKGKLRPIPEGVVLGVPTGIPALARSGLVSPLGLARAGLDLVLPRRRGAGGGDRSVGELIRSRMGGEILELLVDPLLGGINAGDADRLSVAASAPQLADAAARHRSLILGLRGAPKPAPGPVFYAHPQGMERLVDALVARLAGHADVRLGTPVERLEAVGDGGYRLEPADVEADAVVVTTPAFAAADLLAEAAPEGATALRAIDYSSVVLVSLALPSVPDLDASGYLVPKREGRLTTAVSWSSSKWAHLGGDDRAVVRISAGRYGDERAVQMDDDAVVAALLAELREATGVRAEPSEVRVSRWPRAFPQYTPGHLDRVQEIERSVTNALPGVHLAGAAYRGVGIPACIRQGREAARAASTSPSGTALGGSGGR